MNIESSIYEDITSYMANNLKLSFYPTEIYINEVLGIIDETDIKICKILLHDISIFANLLTNNTIFNRCVMEVLFMFIVNNEELEHDTLETIIAEFHNGIFQAVVGDELYNKYIYIIEPNIVNKLIVNIFNLIRIKDKDVVVLGWLKGTDYTIGVMNV